MTPPLSLSLPSHTQLITFAHSDQNMYSLLPIHLSPIGLFARVPPAHRSVCLSPQLLSLRPHSIHSALDDESSQSFAENGPSGLWVEGTGWWRARLALWPWGKDQCGVGLVGYRGGGAPLSFPPTSLLFPLHQRGPPLATSTQLVSHSHPSRAPRVRRDSAPFCPFLIFHSTTVISQPSWLNKISIKPPPLIGLLYW